MFLTTDVSPGIKRPLMGPSCGLAQPPTQKRPDPKAEALIHAGAANYRRLAARAASPRPIRRAQQGALWDLLVRTPNTGGAENAACFTYPQPRPGSSPPEASARMNEPLCETCPGAAYSAEESGSAVLTALRRKAGWAEAEEGGGARLGNGSPHCLYPTGGED